MTVSKNRTRSSSRRSFANPDYPTPGTNAAIARKIGRAEAALVASLERLDAAIADLRDGSSLSQPGDIGRVAAEVEARRGILIGLREAANT